MKKKGCGNVDAQLDVVFSDASWASLNTQYDLAIDANKLNNNPGEVNLTWEEAVNGLPNACDRWLGKIAYCNSNNLNLTNTTPAGICCSTSNQAWCTITCD